MALSLRLMVLAKFGDVSLARISWVGLLVLLVGAVLGFCAAPISKKIWPGQAEQRTVLLRFLGVGIAMVGTLLTLRIFG